MVNFREFMAHTSWRIYFAYILYPTNIITKSDQDQMNSFQPREWTTCGCTQPIKILTYFLKLHGFCRNKLPQQQGTCSTTQIWFAHIENYIFNQREIYITISFYKRGVILQMFSLLQSKSCVPFVHLIISLKLEFNNMEYILK